MYSTSCDLHWFHYTKPAFDPLCFHGTDAGKKEWIVDRIFLWISGRHVLWVRFWILCINLYVFRIFDDDIKVPVLLAGVGNILYGLAVYALQFLLRGRLGLGTYIYRIILPETFYTIILTLIVYRIFYRINYRFMSPSRKESESIWVLK